ncbi:hypothetical protein J437_LFUL000806, partial [Ladona fulva]
GIEWRLSALGLAGKEKLEEEEVKKVTEAGKGSFRKSKEQISAKYTNIECDKVPDSKSTRGSTESVDGKNGPRKDVDDKRPEVEGVAVGSPVQTPKLSQSDSFKSTSSESKLSSSSSQDIPTSVDWHGERVTPPTRPPVPPRRRKGAETPVSDGGDAVKGLQRKDLGEVDGCEDAKANTEIKAVTKETTDCIVAEPKPTEKEIPSSKTEVVKVEEKVEEKVHRGVEGMKLSGKEGETDEGKKIKYSVGSEGTTGDGECCESELSLESTQGDEEEVMQEEEEVVEGCGEWKGVFVRGRRKGSCSSDIEAWKRGLSGWCSVEDEDDFLECTQFDPDDSQSLSVGCGSPLADPEKSVEEWYSSNDAEGRVYYFEENSHESSWTLPEVSITSPSQTPPLAGISASPMGSDSFISGRSSGGEEGLGANGHEEVDREGGSSFALRGEPPMPKVKERQKEWEKATGGRLIQLRENTDKDRGMRNSARATKTRSMILMDPISGEIKMSSYGKILKDWPELWDGNMCILKEGPLNRTKITENGKKVRKNWAPSHVVLTELFLLFFKDAKTFAATKAGNSGGNSSNEPAASPELCVDLSGASVERGDHLSSRRNVFLVTAILGLQVLCQDDNPQNSESWYQEILKVIRQLPSAVDGSPRQNTLERQTYIEAHSPDEHKKFPRIGRSKSVKVKKDASMEDLSVTEKQVKIRARLKKFFHRRPTMESLVKKGIWKDEPAFGCYLDQVSGEGIPRIPLFVQRCIAAIEAKPENMKADGLYRASGNLSQVQKIRLQVDQYNLDILDVEEDVHVLTGALKLFFRELKEPLIPFSLFSKALSASTNPNRKEQLSEFRELVKSLPMANYDTLKYLLQHLLRVTSYQEYNRMHIANLAIVFGPTLMWPEQESLNMALDLMQQNLVIECLLQEFDSIFLSGR